MTTRSRAPRRERVFVTTEIALTLTAAGTSTAGQQISNQCTSDLESRTGRNARAVTIGRVWVTGLWFTTAVVTTPVLIGLSLGMGVFTQSTDVADFPNVASHLGDWFVHRTWRLTDRGAATVNPTPLQPEDAPGNSAGFQIDNRSQRKLGRFSNDLFLVIQKDIATEEDIQFHSDVTVMWILD